MEQLRAERLGDRKMANKTKLRYSRKDVMKHLPQRGDMLFVDSIVSYPKANKIIAKKLVKGSEWYFKGHFPEEPIMPGHLMSEAMAQACAAYLIIKFRDVTYGKFFYLASSNVKFLNLVKPRALLVTTVEPLKAFAGGGMFKVKMSVKNKIVAKGVITTILK